MNTITLNNLHTFSVDLESSAFNWLFKSKDETQISREHTDQIFILNKEAANFLWNFDMKVNNKPLHDYPNLEKHFKIVRTYELPQNKELSKWLYECEIPFDQKVFMSIQPDLGCVLTWKMVIKYSHNIFIGHDLAIWDKTLNWMLTFHHDDKWHFAKDRVE